MKVSKAQLLFSMKTNASLFLSLLSVTRLETSVSYTSPFFKIHSSGPNSYASFIFFTSVFPFHFYCNHPNTLYLDCCFLSGSLSSLTPCSPTSLHLLNLRQPHQPATHAEFCICSSLAHMLYILGILDSQISRIIPAHPGESTSLALHLCSSYFSCFECHFFNSNY